MQNVFSFMVVNGIAESDVTEAKPSGSLIRLLARQQSFAGVGRFDLLFSDRHGTNILMELKAITPKYDVADQLARYKDELERRGEKNILMWLVAPQIPNSIREFLD
jgi:RecB family endonuclease NucS